MIYYVCKYTPIEMLKGFGVEVKLLDNLVENFDSANAIAHQNLCGYGKSVVETVLSQNIKELILVNCCDTMRRCYDVIKDLGICDFLYFLDLPHETGDCAVKYFTREIDRLVDEYSKYKNMTFDEDKYFQSFETIRENSKDFIAITGARVGKKLENIILKSMPLPVVNYTCNANRRIYKPKEFSTLAYAKELLNQFPCSRMNNSTARRKIYESPNLKGIIYHTIKFCDFYGAEYALMKKPSDVRVLKIETDYTTQSTGQLSTRLEAFAETFSRMDKGKSKMIRGKYYVAGIDSGSTSIDVVIMDSEKNILGYSIVPTGAGAYKGAKICLEKALKQAGLNVKDLSKIVTTGYGRDYIEFRDESITEITCHGKGANYLNPNVRTIIDIGGQDSKVISVDEKGNVKNFVMNDKCAAGTGRFLDMMANALGIKLDEMKSMGIVYDEDITISSMCTVFAESEVVSLVAQNKKLEDIIHGINKSVAVKIAALVNRLNTEGEYMITGGVAKNIGVVKAIEEKLNIKLYVSDKAQLCGAIGAALFAIE